ncbi:RhoGAP-domain-containing protein [Laetiporus sulphureus 93-53]|uniref:RhoGAP-domain-containing protein n=1 Tax=Laetiporus sulphureus 93-53 TaxID=1314785 RepID=A0A165H0B7_9APHY|nr:RhoGAP-domain-containing protein [Laetiporus sulphureus 93-53]KZT11074.1 RhoGAP-domain-containing protein [Laetiporus sulphureus 93-53]
MQYPHARSRSREAYAHASSSSSLSSAAPSDLLPAASNSSQSDIGTDLSASFTSSSSSHSHSCRRNPVASPSPAPAPSNKHRFFALARGHRATTSSANPMGQVLASPSSNPPPNVDPPRPSSPGGRFKRAWGRRKKSEDITSVFSSTSKGKERASSDLPPSSYPGSSVSDLSHTISRTSSDSHGLPGGPPTTRSPRALNPIQIASNKLGFGGKRTVSGQSPKSPSYSGSPPPPPPKEPPLSPPLAAPQPSLRAPRTAHMGVHPDGPPLSRIRSAVKDQLPPLPPHPSVPSPPLFDKERERLKEDWRKSDSTVMSHSTIRPGARGGNRSPRPTSVAESSHSGNTIIPPVNKRLSALITDAEFNVLEEGPGDHSDWEEEETEEIPGISCRTEEALERVVSREQQREKEMRRTKLTSSPAGSIKTRNRRSISLNLGPGHGTRTSVVEEMVPIPPKASSSVGHAMSVPNTPLSATHSRDAPTLTRAAANGFIAPTSAPGALHSTGSNIKSKLAAWTAAASMSQGERPPPPTSRRKVQQQQLQQNRNAAQMRSTSPQTGFRQTAVSMTGGLGPAAMGLGKRAVSKVGRAWGLGSSSANMSAGPMTSASMTSLQSTEVGLGRTVSRDSTKMHAQAGFGGGAHGAGQKKRRFGHRAPSVAPSLTSSSASASDLDGFALSGPSLGRRVRGPKRTPSGASIIGGLVFKRDLRTCVKESAIDSVKEALAAEELEGKVEDRQTGEVVLVALEERRLPAVVVRCAQHLMKWGVEEEGLFRVSGRSSHVAKLRSEFDAGSDWDMQNCDPSDLDPHAVASIFKTFLRELPESILTSNLIPYFESALGAEGEAARTSIDSSADGSVRSAAPSHHRSGSALLRKAPSLSTLAVPAFAGRRAMSESLLNALAWLISQLPRENRDLLYTVVELIRATAARSKETKMPLGNLLLVFCPSLNMNPTLLRVLCEHESIWQGVPKPQPEEEPDVEEDGAGVRATFVTARETVHAGDSGSDIISRQPSSSSTDEPTEDEESNLNTPEDAQGAAVAVSDDGHLNKDEYRHTHVTPELVLLPPISPISPVSLKDDSSYVSAPEPSSAAPTRSPSPAVPDGYSSHGVPPLSSSAESLSSPSETSAEPSSPEPHSRPYGRPSMDTDTDVELDEREEPHSSSINQKPVQPHPMSRSQDSFGVLVDTEKVDMALPSAPPRPLVNTRVSPSAPLPAALGISVPFPATGGSTPNTPISRRKSFGTLLSFSKMRSVSGTSVGSASSVEAAQASAAPVVVNSPPPSSWGRSKRPSLHLLLQKLSGSGLNKQAAGTASVDVNVKTQTAVYSQPSGASASLPALSLVRSLSPVQKPSPTTSESMSPVSPQSMSPESIVQQDMPVSSVPVAPPKLDTAISSSPITLGFDGSPVIERVTAKAEIPSIVKVDAPAEELEDNDQDEDVFLSPVSPSPRSIYPRSRTDSLIPSLYTTPLGMTPKTPIADLYQVQGRSHSALGFFEAVGGRLEKEMEEEGKTVENGCGGSQRGKLRVMRMARSTSEASQMSQLSQVSYSSSMPSIMVNVEGTQEDWAQSVLMAAHSSGSTKKLQDTAT